MTPYGLIFLAGLAGSFHCIGMCGGFACAIGSDPRGPRATLLRHLTYNTGRLTTYCFLGAVAGYLGLLATGHADIGATGVMQRALALISGALMVVIGLQFLGYLARWRLALRGGGYLAQALRSLLGETHPAMPLAFGVFNGFLPCPLVYAFAAQAAASAGPLPGILTMAAFGLGTFPAMLLMGGVGARQRLRGVRIAGAFVVLLGVITLARGALPLGFHLH